jgi:hypothetical protein
LTPVSGREGKSLIANRCGHESYASGHHRGGRKNNETFFTFKTIGILKMISKSGIKYTSAIALVSMLVVPAANAGLKQLEIKGGISAAGHTIDYGKQTDSGILMDGDLDFKMKFSQDVTAQLDLEFDNMVGGSTSGSNAAGNAPNRFDIGVDQAFFKLNDFLFRNFSMSVGKQNFNVSLRDNNSNSWAYGDPVSVIGAYSTRDMDIKGYFLKQNEAGLGSMTTTAGVRQSNDADADVVGVTGEYWLNDDSLVMAYLNYKADKASTVYDNLIHYGIGLDYFIGESLEVYGEIAGQNISSSTGMDGSAFQLTLGGEYAFSDYDMKPTIGLEYYLQSGSDASDPAWQDVAGGWSAADSDSLFMERSGGIASSREINSGTGFVNKGSTGTKDSNGAKIGPDGYSVIRLNAAINPSKSTKVGLGVHFFKNEDTVGVVNDDLGTEIDLYANWKYSQDVTFRAGAFLVSDSSTGAAASEDITGVAVSSALKF